MSKGGSSTQVEAVDPFQVARADATFIRIDQFTPLGSLTFSDTGGGFNNVANLQFIPGVEDLTNRQLLSDRFLLDTALGRQQQINQGGLPSLTTGLETGGLPPLTAFNPAISGGQNFIRPQGSGFDPPPPDVPVPNFINGFQDRQDPHPGGASPVPAGVPFPGGVPPGIQPFSPVPNFINGFQDRQDPQKGGAQATPQVAPGVQASPLGKLLSGQRGSTPPQQFLGGSTTNPPNVPRGTAGPIPTLGGLPGAPGIFTDPNASIGGDFEGSRGRVEQNLFDRGAGLLNRQFQQDEDRLRQSLANRGLTGTSAELGEAANTELGNFQQNRNEAFQRLANDAVLAGGAEQSRLFGLEEAAGRFGLGAQQQAFGQALGSQDFTRSNRLAQFDAANRSRETGIQDVAFANQTATQSRQAELAAQLQQANLAQANRATQFNELAALLGLQQVAQPGLNNFFTPGQADVTGAFGLQQNAQIANARNAQAGQSGVLGGLFGLGSAALGNQGGIKGAFG